MKNTVFLYFILICGLSFGQTCNKLNHNCSNTVGLNTSGVTSNGGSTYACSLGDNVLYTSSTNAYIATGDIFIGQGNAATLHFDARKSASYFGTCEIWVHVGGYCSYQLLSAPFNSNGWVQIGTFSPTTSCTSFGPYTVPSDVIGGTELSYCIVPKNASSSAWVSIDNICVSEISGSAVATTLNEDFGTSSTGWYPNSGVGDIPYHTYKNASDAYVILGTGVGGGSDKAAYFYTGFDFCSTVSGTGIVTKEVNTAGYTNGEIRVQFKSKYPCSGANSYTFDENYQSYSPEIFIMQGPDNGSNSWVPLPVNYYFADYTWRVASYDISAYNNANVRFKIERGGFCGTAMEAIDNIQILDRNCDISLLSCGTITGETAPLQNTNYPYSVPAVTGATYYKWYVREGGNLYDTAPYIVSGQGTLNPTINFQTLPASGVRVLCIPFDADPSSNPNACYAEIGILGVTVTVSNPLTIDNVTAIDPLCFGGSDGSISLTISGGQAPYSYVWSPNVSTTNSATGLVAGPYTITITDSNLDQVVQNVTLTDPAVFAASCSTNPTICVGDTVQLNPGLFGGTAPYSLVWTPNSEISDVNVEMPFVWPSSTTIYDLTATDANGCLSNCSVTVTVNPLPVPDLITNTISGCGPLSVSFSNTTFGTDVNCVLDFGDGTSLNNCTLGSHLYNTAGTYDIVFTVEDDNGCIGTTIFDDLIIVFQSPTVIAGNDTTVCEGDAITLTANNPDAAILTWNNGITDGVAFVPIATATYIVNGDLSGCTDADTIVVTVVEPPSILLGPDIVSCNAFETLDAGPGMDSYFWSNTQTTQTIAATASGDYWVTVELNGCATTDTINVTLLDCSGFVDFSGSNISVYPNPTNDLVFIKDIPENTAVTIFSSNGQLLSQVKVKNSSAEIEMLNFEAGVYFIQFSNETQSKTIQIVKQ